MMDSVTVKTIISISSVIQIVYLLFLGYVFFKKPSLRKVVINNQLHVLTWVAIMLPLMLVVLFHLYDSIPLELLSIWFYCGVLQMSISKLFTLMVKWLDWKKGDTSC